MNSKQMLLAIPSERHELAMQEAIKVALANPAYPFGAVIANGRTTEVSCSLTSTLQQGSVLDFIYVGLGFGHFCRTFPRTRSHIKHIKHRR